MTDLHGAVAKLCDDIDAGAYAVGGSGSMDFGRGVKYVSDLLRILLTVDASLVAAAPSPIFDSLPALPRE